MRDEREKKMKICERVHVLVCVCSSGGGGMKT